MNGNQLFADVILPLPLGSSFTYRIPEDLENSLRKGCRVIVSFGKKKIYTGLVKEIHQNCPVGFEIKDIISVLDDQPLINDFQFLFWDWISEYYMCSSGDVFKAALPSGLKLESESNIIVSENISLKDLPEDERSIFELVSKKNMITIREFHSAFKEKQDIKALKSLIEKNAVSVIEKMRDTPVKPKLQTFFKLNEKYNSKKKLNLVFNILEKHPKQLEILMYYIQLPENRGKCDKYVNKNDFLNKKTFSESAFKTLIKNEIFIATELPAEGSDISTPVGEINKLNEFQEVACEKILEGFTEKDICLLYGVTSSGKTEIYIHLIKKYLDEGKQVLYLLPEIALTAQIINRLRRVFGDAVGVYHSKFSDRERVNTWTKVREESGYKLILGVRSSVFLPFYNLGLIIIDEEHENTYKQYDPAPRYNARDSAVMLAKIHNARILMGTATPSAESYTNAITGKYELVELTQRYLEIQMPEIILADIKEARRKKIMQGNFTPQLIKGIAKALEAKEQVILFQNRRGFSPYMECNVCGWIPKCNHCDVSMVYHKNLNKLVCHYCGFSTNVPKTCIVCDTPGLNTMGFGTEKIEDEISALFPGYKIARLDLDTTRSKKSYEKIIYDFENRKIDILIGTQMVSKGLDFDNVSLVGILNAGNLLNYPDFRAYERSFQLMTQVSGRAGRKEKQGKVIIQTSDPEHPIIQYVKNGEFRRMYDEQMKERKSFKYPPHYHLIKILLKHKKSEILSKASAEFVFQLKKVFGNRVLGPESPPVGRIQQFYIKQVLVKVEKEKSYSKAKYLIREEINSLLSDKKYKSVLTVVDVDPM